MSDSESSEQTCAVCAGEFTKKIKPLICPNCPEDTDPICVPCTKRYLEESTQSAHCMMCKQPWSYLFLHKNFTRTWLTNEYRKSRQHLAAERERSMLPMSLPLVEEAKRKREIDDRIRENMQQERRLKEELYQLRRLRGELFLIRENPNVVIGEGEHPEIETKKIYMFPCPSEDCKGFIESKNWSCALCNVKVCKSCHTKREIDKTDKKGKLIKHVCKQEDIDSAKEIMKNTKSCPACHTRIFKTEGCFGKDTEILMGDSTICNIQDIKVGDYVMGDDGKPKVVLDAFSGKDELFEVSQMLNTPGGTHEYIVSLHHTLVLYNWDIERDLEITVFDYLKLENKDHLRGIRHHFTNEPINIVSIGMGQYYGIKIDSESHRLVLGSGIISKNCLQMFCTQCHTAFNWNTGQIETGKIHNPHYFELQRKLGGAPMRDVRDIPCGDLQIGFLEWLGSERLYNKFQNYRRRVMEVHHRITQLAEQGFEDIRLNFLLNKITCDRDFRRSVFLRERTNEKKREERQILETFRVAVIERFNDLNNEIVPVPDKASPKKTRKIIEANMAKGEAKLLEMRQIVDFCNDAFRENFKALGYRAIPVIYRDIHYGGKPQTLDYEENDDTDYSNDDEGESYYETE